jgi:hypothetical protein
MERWSSDKSLHKKISCLLLLPHSVVGVVVKKSYCHVCEWLETGFGLVNRFIDNLYSHDSWPHFTDPIAHAKSRSVVVCTSRFLATDFNTGTITASLNHTLQISHIKPFFHSRTFNWALLNLTRCHFTPTPGVLFPYQLSSKPRLPYKLSARTTQKSPFLSCCTIVAFMSVAAGTCLPSRCLETASVYLPVSGRCIATVLHATVLSRFKCCDY